MSACLAVCTKDEQRGVIRFLWAEGVKSAEIHSCTTYALLHDILGVSQSFCKVGAQTSDRRA